ncbi:MAG: DUF4190 domain-containing protein [Polyangiaceae bacterium]|jgi:hypothetical protein
MPPMPGPPPPPQGWRTGGPPPSTDTKAVVSLVLGILSLVATFCWLGLPLGVPAIVFGTLAHRDIKRSDGMAGGRGMATAGIVLGSLGSLVFVGWVGFLVFAMASAKSASTAPLPPPVLPPVAATAAPVTPPGGWGKIHVVDLHSSTSPLRSQLADEVKAAKTAGETVLVETTAAACAACTEIARAMRDAPLQTALASVRLVRLDVREVGSELPALGMKEPALPWFYVIDARGDVRDGISADEWDDNDAEDVAPVLDAFLHGKLRSRRRPWRGTTL